MHAVLSHVARPLFSDFVWGWGNSRSYTTEKYSGVWSRETTRYSISGIAMVGNG